MAQERQVRPAPTWYGQAVPRSGRRRGALTAAISLFKPPVPPTRTSSLFLFLTRSPFFLLPLSASPPLSSAAFVLLVRPAPSTDPHQAQPAPAPAARPFSRVIFFFFPFFYISILFHFLFHHSRCRFYPFPRNPNPGTAYPYQVVRPVPHQYSHQTLYQCTPALLLDHLLCFVLGLRL